MLTHIKELIRQNAEKLRLHWPEAPLGIYSAGLGQRDTAQITFAGIQSIHRQEVGHIDLVLIDEAHLVSHRNEGIYRAFINRLSTTNPRLKVIGLSATPFRLGHGLITDKPAIFDDILEPVSIEELTAWGYLAPLRSKVTHKKLSADGVHKRGGEYIEKELQQAVNTNDNNIQVVDEVLRLAGDRRHWLFFCAGVDHTERVAEILRARGVKAEAVTGKTKDRDRILEDFKAGRITALTNPNVLTTGFDYPDIDLIVMMRPTMSPGLYIQMAGRGLRPKSHTDHCLVLDFAGIVEQHGPITAVQTPRKPGEGVAPSKICPECDEIIHASLKACPVCSYVFPVKEKDPMHLHNDDIMGDGGKTMAVNSWAWEVKTSRKSGIDMVRVTYFGALSDRPISEYLCLLHSGYAGYKAMEALKMIASKSGGDYMDCESLEELAKRMVQSDPPTEIVYKRDGKFYRVIDKIWGEKEVVAFVDEKDSDFIWF